MKKQIECRSTHEEVGKRSKACYGMQKWTKGTSEEESWSRLSKMGNFGLKIWRKSSIWIGGGKCIDGRILARESIGAGEPEVWIRLEGAVTRITWWNTYTGRPMRARCAALWSRISQRWNPPADAKCYRSQGRRISATAIYYLYWLHMSKGQ